MKAFRAAGALALTVVIASNCALFGVATENYVNTQSRATRAYIIELSWYVRCHNLLATTQNPRPPVGTPPYRKMETIPSTSSTTGSKDWTCPPIPTDPDPLNNPPPPPPGWPN